MQGEPSVDSSSRRSLGPAARRLVQGSAPRHNRPAKANNGRGGRGAAINAPAAGQLQPPAEVDSTNESTTTTEQRETASSRGKTVKCLRCAREHGADAETKRWGKQFVCVRCRQSGMVVKSHCDTRQLGTEAEIGYALGGFTVVTNRIPHPQPLIRTATAAAMAFSRRAFKGPMGSITSQSGSSSSSSSSSRNFSNGRTNITWVGGDPNPHMLADEHASHLRDTATAVANSRHPLPVGSMCRCGMLCNCHPASAVVFLDNPDPYVVAQYHNMGRETFVAGLNLSGVVGHLPLSAGHWTTQGNGQKVLHIVGAAGQTLVRNEEWLHGYDSFLPTAGYFLSEYGRISKGMVTQMPRYEDWIAVKDENDFANRARICDAMYNNGHKGIGIEVLLKSGIFVYRLFPLDSDVPRIGSPDYVSANQTRTAFLNGQPHFKSPSRPRDVHYDRHRLTIVSHVEDGLRVKELDKAIDVCIPRSLINHARDLSKGKARGPDLLQRVLHSLNSQAIALGVPEHETSLYTTYAAVIGMVTDVDSEIEALSILDAVMNTVPNLNATDWFKSWFNKTLTMTRAQRHDWALKAKVMRQHMSGRMRMWWTAAMFAGATFLNRMRGPANRRAFFTAVTAFLQAVRLALIRVLGGSRPLSILNAIDNYRSRLIVNTTIVPIVEEAIKRVAPGPMSLLFGFIESRGPPIDRFKMMAAKSGLHYGLAKMPYPVAVVLHSYWNHVALQEANPPLIARNAKDVLDVAYARDVRPGTVVLNNLCYSDETGQHDPGKIRAGSVVKPPMCLGRCVAKPSLILYGIGTNYAIPTTFRPCHHNEERAVSARALMPTEWSEAPRDDLSRARFLRMFSASPEFGVLMDHATLANRYLANPYFAVEAYWKEASQLLALYPEFIYIKLAEHLGMNNPEPWNFESWLKRFPGIQEAVREAAIRTAEQGYLSTVDMPAESFIKQENAVTYTPFRDNSHKEPRLIQGRSFAVKAFSGPQTLAVHKLLQKVLTGIVTYGPGLNAENIGAWYGRAIQEVSELGAGPVTVIEGDASRWDAHVHKECLGFISGFYRQLMPNETLFLDAMDVRNGRRRGRTKTGFRYSVEGTVNSGDGDTTCGNTLAHAMIFLRFFHLILAHPDSGEIASLKTLPARAILMGDDNVLVIQTDLWNKFKVLFIDNAKFSGHKFEIVERNISTAEFCSGRFYPIAGSFVFGPKPGRVIAKTFWSREFLRSHKAKAWLHGTLLSLKRSCQFIPVLRVIISLQLHLLQEPPITSVKVEVRYHTASLEHEADEETYNHMFDVYGLTKAQLDECEAWLRNNVHSLPTMVRHPVLLRMVEVDT